MSGKFSKFSNTYLYLFSNKRLVIRAGIHKMLVTKANRETLIRLLLQKQSDLALPCLVRLFVAGNYCSKFKNIYRNIYFKNELVTNVYRGEKAED